MSIMSAFHFIHHHHFRNPFWLFLQISSVTMWKWKPGHMCVQKDGSEAFFPFLCDRLRYMIWIKVHSYRKHPPSHFAFPPYHKNTYIPFDCWNRSGPNIYNMPRKPGCVFMRLCNNPVTALSLTSTRVHRKTVISITTCVRPQQKEKETEETECCLLCHHLFLVHQHKAPASSFWAQGKHLCPDEVIFLSSALSSHSGTSWDMLI